MAPWIKVVRKEKVGGLRLEPGVMDAATLPPGIASQLIAVGSAEPCERPMHNNLIGAGDGPARDMLIRNED